jgi:hypothetical protein
MKTEKLVEIKIMKSNIAYYKSKGYDNLNINKYNLIKSKDVLSGSGVRIYVMCENCNSERYIACVNYHNQIKKSGYYVCQKCTNVKVRETNIKRYGNPCPLQNKEVEIKSKKKLLVKYGVDNISKSPDIKSDRSKIMKSPIYQENLKNGVIKKYGVDNPSKSEHIKNKKIKTTLSNYGVENPSQSYEIFERSQKSGKKIKLHDCGLMYRGTYEKDFLDYCYKNGIIVEKGPTIKFTYKGKKRYYHSDFIIPSLNLICEIKSSYYYELFKDINDAKKEGSEENGYSFVFIKDKEYNVLTKFNIL